MATTADDIINRVREILNDPSGIRWPDADLYRWMGDAQRDISLLKPDATATTSVLTTVAGTRQTIPTNGSRLLRVIRNMSAASGGTGGKSIRPVSRELLDAQQPDWHDPTVAGDAAHAAVIKNYFYDEDEPLAFYVYPGATGTTSYLEITYSKIADDPSSGSDALIVSDIFRNAVADYVVFKAYQSETEIEVSQQKATQFYNMFLTSVTGKSQIDQVTTPNLRRGPGSNG